MFEFVVNMNEVLDTRVPVESWTKVGNELRGTLNFKGDEFTIVLDPKTYTLNEHVYSWINVAFNKIVDDLSSEELTYSNKSGSAVIGAIFHAVQDKLEELDFDAIVFRAVDNIERRMRIYNASQLHMFKNFRSRLENVKFGDGSVGTILFDDKLSNLQKNNFAEFIKKSQEGKP